MEKIDIKESGFEDLESCYHLSRSVCKEGIAEEGLKADIGIRSTDRLGNEKNPKVFFTKSIEGALKLFNRNYNIFYSVAKYNDFNLCEGGLKDDEPKLYKKIFDEMVHDNMTEEEKIEAAIALGNLYSERGIFYKLDLNHATREEFERMTDDEKEDIDYLSDDINEERPDEQMTINNMHTRAGRSVAKEQMSLIGVDGNESAFEIAMKMCEYYTKNINSELPVLKSKKGNEDKNILKEVYKRYIEKNKVNKDESMVGEPREGISMMETSTMNAIVSEGGTREMVEEADKVEEYERNSQKDIEKDVK